MDSMIREIRPAAARRRTRCERGQSLLELAIALPILLALVIGIFEFGLAWNRRQVVTNAAREGARYLVLPDVDEDEASEAVTIYLLSANLDPDLATINTNEGAGVGTPATVTVSYPYQFQFLGPIVALLGGSGAGMTGTITLTSTAVMRNE